MHFMYDTDVVTFEWHFTVNKLNKVNLNPNANLVNERQDTFPLIKIVIYDDYYWFPVPTPLGLVITLSFLVMVRPNNRKVSTCIYMAAISVNDNVMLFFSNQ